MSGQQTPAPASSSGRDAAAPLRSQPSGAPSAPRSTPLSRDEVPRSEVTKTHTLTQDDVSNICGLDDVDDTVCVGEDDEMVVGSDLDDDDPDGDDGDDAALMDGDEATIHSLQPTTSGAPSQARRSEGRPRSRPRSSRVSSDMRRSNSMHHLGKKLNFAELQRNFGVGLKQAAQQLGVCPTTLKRACRRHGIQRWPARQVVKLTKQLHEAGYRGADLHAVRDLTLTRHFQALHKKGVRGLGNLKDIGDLRPVVPSHIQELPYPGSGTAKPATRKSVDLGAMRSLPAFTSPDATGPDTMCRGGAGLDRLGLPPAGSLPALSGSFAGFAPKPEVDAQITSAPATDNSPAEYAPDQHVLDLAEQGGSMEGVLRPLDDPWADRWLDDMINEHHPWLDGVSQPLI